jgi:hypothetical protein
MTAPQEHVLARPPEKTRSDGPPIAPISTICTAIQIGESQKQIYVPKFGTATVVITDI